MTNGIHADSADQDLLPMPGIDPLPGDQDEDEIDDSLTATHVQSQPPSLPYPSQPSSSLPQDFPTTETSPISDDVLDEVTLDDIGLSEDTSWLERCLLKGLDAARHTEAFHEDAVVDTDLQVDDLSAPLVMNIPINQSMYG